MPSKIREIDVVEAAPAVRRTATANGSGVSVANYVGTAAFVLQSSAGGGTSPTLDVKLQQSSDDGGSDAYADISGATFTQLTDAADTTEAIYVDLDGSEQYIRCVFTIGGTSPTFDCGVLLLAKNQYI